ncbi:MAG: type II toxin-antitoxin system RelE/ParE family toxin [Zoogloeaceae bacterium]|jgi:plasmid stabilization system protein ParE|nr:type II toxin-antitoxin system RelE/ParE family toxin [Zoogloeaceae bacterium]
MPRLSWSPPALRDVQRLYRFLVTKNPDAAKRAVKAIRQGIRVLAAQPQIGRSIEDMPDEYREWMIDFGGSGYVTRYRYDEARSTVIMLAVWHQKEADL